MRCTAGALWCLTAALTLSSTHAAAAPFTPGQIWPKPHNMTVNTACGHAETINLRRALLAVYVKSGKAEEGVAYVKRAWKLAQQDWRCGPSFGRHKATVRVLVENATCTSPACYTHATNESYNLTITKAGGVQIFAQTLVGATHAFASLASLASPSCDVSCLPILVQDAPRFGHRGILLDTSRNWFSVDDIKAKIIDPMHLSKLNVLKWHVYDSQAQPLEVKFMPALWQPYSRGQAYTQRQARELVDYAWHRGVRILPKFDMPGHTAIFAKADKKMVSCLNALPWDGQGWDVGTWCNQPPAGQLKPEYVGVAQSLLTEWLTLFNGSYLVSTGADEVNFNCWEQRIVPKNSGEYPAFLTASLEKLKTFQTKIAGTVRGVGRAWGVYDESFGDWEFGGTPALPPGTVIFSWTHEDLVPEMTAAGYPVVLMPWQNWYLDCGIGSKESAPKNWCAPLKGWQTMYEYDPLSSFKKGGPGDPSKILGGEAAMWSEHLRPAVLDYVVWPRAAAMAERLWSATDATRSADAAAPRLQQLMAQLERRGLRPSSLEWEGDNFKYDLLPQWCDTVKVPQVDSSGEDYCATAKSYAGVDLAVFANLVDKPY